MAVWTSVFLHEFLDGDLSNLHAVPGSLTVRSDSRTVGPTPEQADRGFMVRPGRTLGYRFHTTFQDVIGVELSLDLLIPRQFAVIRRPVLPLLSLGDGTVRVSLGQLETRSFGRDADPADKAEVYRQLGLRLTYHPDARIVRAEAHLDPHYRGEMDRVRGGT